MLGDLRHAFRALRRSPGFSVVTVLTLAVGIGVTTTMFSVIDAVLLEPLAFANPGGVMTVWESNPGIGVEQEQVSAGTFVDWRSRTRRFTDLAAYQNDGYVLTGRGEPTQLTGATVTPSLFTILGVPTVLGRTFNDEEGEPGAERVVVLSHGFWQRRFGGEPDVLGTALTLDAEPYTVVGVMPPSFRFPPDQNLDLWIPLAVPERLIPVRAMRVYNVVGRLESNADPALAQAELAALAREIAAEYPQSNSGWTAAVTPALDQILGDTGTLLLLLTGAAAFVLLIGCANVANLLLARAMRQQGEYAIRATLGARPGHLMRRSLAESLVLVAAGGIVGVLAAVWGVSVLRAVLPADVPRVENIAVDGSVLLFAIGLSLMAGLAFGLAPALQVIRPRLAVLLQGSVTGGVGSRFHRALLGGLVSTEVALALMLLVGSAALVRSLNRLLDVDPGFRTADVVSVALELPETQYRERPRQQQFYNELVDRVAELPGVTEAGAVSALPMSALGTEFDLPFEIPGRDAPTPGERPRAEYRAVIPGYFTTLGIPLRRGRLLDRFDRNEGRPVMVINESMERTFFSDVDAIGQHLGVPMAGSIEIVGVVGDVKHAGLGEDARPEMFVSYQNFPLREMHVVARTDPESTGTTIRAIREVVRSLDPQLPVAGSAPVADLVSESLTGARFNTVLLAIFSACALLLAAVGIYGIVSYSVEQRTGEIGMRMALGAGPGDTMRLVLRQALGFVAVGSVVGVAGAVVISRWLQGMLFEVSALSPLVVVGVIVFLFGVSIVATGVPTRRAMRIDPVIALRTD
jgi:putative ABC transport system permease protein